jgi:hypothetical protein
MTNHDRILNFLQSVSPESATNSEIVSRTGVKPHNQVFQITQYLMKVGAIKGRRIGNEWTFSALGGGPAPESSPRSRAAGLSAPFTSGRFPSIAVTAADFEEYARGEMERHFNTPLAKGSVPDVPKKWDMVSPDHRVVGDAKFLTLVQGERLPPAKFSMIAEHVW